MEFYINGLKKQNNNKRQMIEEYCESKDSGALQQKIWKPRELNMTKTKQHDEMNDQLQNTVWDPGILKTEYYDQEVILLSSWGV